MKTARVHHAARRRGGAWPLAARAQQPERMRRIGALSPLPADDPEAKARIAAFLQGLAQLGWTDGRNVRIDSRWGAGDADRIRRYAAELVALAPDVILATSSVTRRAVAAGDPHRPDRVRVGHRPGWCWLRRQLGAAGRQHHRFYRVRIWHEREMAGAAQTDRAWRDASGSHSGSRHSLRDRSVRRNPGRGTTVRGRGEPSQRARRRGDRARHHGIRARVEWWPDRDGSHEDEH